MTKKLTCTPQEFNLHTRCKVLVTVFGLTKKADILVLPCQSVPIWQGVSEDLFSFQLFSRLFVWVSGALPTLLRAYSLLQSLLTVKIVGV